MDSLEDLIKKLKRRNYREWLACSIIAPFFLYSFFNVESMTLKLAYGELYLASLFVAAYIYKNGHRHLSSALSQKEVIKNEINFLSNTRYWYVLPFFIGLAIVEFKAITDSIDMELSLFEPILHGIGIIVLSLVLIYLNEVFAVRKLKGMLSKL